MWLIITLENEIPCVVFELAYMIPPDVAFELIYMIPILAFYIVTLQI